MKTKLVMSGLILVIVALAVSTVLGGGVAQEYTGQQWDYQVESFAFPVASPSPSAGLADAVSVPAGTPPPPPDMPTVIRQRLNELGAEGWELVSSDLLPGEGSPIFVWIFKRPAE